MDFSLNFSHGGGVEAFARKVGCDIEEVIDLSSNINFIKPDITLDMNTIKINSYPTYDKLYKTLTNHFKIDRRQLEVFNGGSCAIFALMNFLPQQNCYIYSPAYLEYKKATLATNKNLELINRFTDLNCEIETNSLVVFVNPSTPDGSLYEMEKLLEYWDKKNCTVIIDESFLEFTNAPSLSSYIKRYKNLYILTSMTKFYSCAGVRIGCVLSNEQNITQLKNKEPLWKLSQFDSIYMQALLEDTRFRKLSLGVNAKAKADLELIIKEFDSLFELVVPSMANFILVRLKSMKADKFQERLLPYKIMIRDCSNFDFLSDEYIRIAVKSQKELQVFRKAVEDIVS
jgi:threonine-phosphate decarboxylase